MTESQIVPSVRPQSHSCHFPCSLVNFYPQGWYQPGIIILARDFLSTGMKSAGNNHPWKRIFIHRDDISRDESSLQENFYPQGWNQQGIIILAREFLSPGMKSAGNNHPRKRIFIRRDDISRDESSLEVDFYPQGWNQQGRIIPGGGFLSAGMKSVRMNHPWKRFFIRRDEISREESSLEEIFYPQGWNQLGIIILGREFLSTGMISARNNHPCKRILIHRDEISREESSLEKNFYPQGWYQPGWIILGKEFLSADNMKWPHICSIVDSPLYYVWHNHSKMVYHIQKEVTNE